MSARRSVPRWAPASTLAATLAATFAAVLVAGCAAPGGGASTNNDVNRCAAVLPLARDVVHGNGTLTLVRPINREQVETIVQEVGAAPPAHTPPTHNPPAHAPHPPPVPNPAQDPAAKGPKTCLVVYQGSYDTTALPQAQPAGARGRYALIVLWVRHPSVVRVLISDTLPAGTRRSWWHL